MHNIVVFCLFFKEVNITDFDEQTTFMQFWSYFLNGVLIESVPYELNKGTAV